MFFGGGVLIQQADGSRFVRFVKQQPFAADREQAEEITFLRGWNPLRANPHRHGSARTVAKQFPGGNGHGAAVRRHALSGDPFGCTHFAGNFDSGRYAAVKGISGARFAAVFAFAGADRLEAAAVFCVDLRSGWRFSIKFDIADGAFFAADIAPGIVGGADDHGFPLDGFHGFFFSDQFAVQIVSAGFFAEGDGQLMPFAGFPQRNVVAEIMGLRVPQIERKRGLFAEFGDDQVYRFIVDVFPLQGHEEDEVFTARLPVQRFDPQRNTPTVGFQRAVQLEDRFLFAGEYPGGSVETFRILKLPSGNTAVLCREQAVEFLRAQRQSERTE